MRAHELVVVSGVSGSGKSTALNALEDMGFFCIENLPAPLISNLVEYLRNSPNESFCNEIGGERNGANQCELSQPCMLDYVNYSSGSYALLLDCRDSRFASYISQSVEQLKLSNIAVSVLLLDCDDDVLIRRFRETRRPHPLITKNISHGCIINNSSISEEAIRKVLACERIVLSGIKELADHVIDTSSFTPHELRRAVENWRGVRADNLEIVIESFGFKYGVPQHVDLLIDVRFLPNPHFVSHLKDKTGKHSDVQDYVFGSGDAEELLVLYVELLKFLIPRYKKEGKRCLTVGVGCTGGRHRSVAIAVKMLEKLKESGLMLTIQHRDVDR